MEVCCTWHGFPKETKPRAHVQFTQNHYQSSYSSSSSTTTTTSSTSTKHLIIFSLESQPPNLPHLFCMWHRLPRPRRGNLLSQGGSHGTSHDGYSGPAKASHVAAEIQGFGTSVLDYLRVPGIWFLVTAKKNKQRTLQNLSSWKCWTSRCETKLWLQNPHHFRNAMCLWKTHEAGGRDGRFPQT